jgi:SAM-dependent methyltransferase
MLAALRAKTSAVPAVAGDATRLPFAGDTFDSAIACHVLHLIPDWRRAVEELARVVGPGGTILINLGGWDHGIWRAIEERFVAEAGIENPRVGATDAEEVDAVMTGLGATVRVLPNVRDNRQVSYGELLDRMEQGMYSFTWGTDQATRSRATETVRQWVAHEHGSLDEPRDQPWIVSWRAYDLRPSTKKSG